MRRCQFTLFLFLLFGLQPLLGLRCFYCNLNAPAAGADVSYSCSLPAQEHCRFPASCIRYISENTVVMRCVNLRKSQNGSDSILAACEKSKKVNKENCKICNTDLCNGSKKIGSRVWWTFAISVGVLLGARIVPT